MSQADYCAPSMYQPPKPMKHVDKALSKSTRLSLADAPPLSVSHGTNGDRYPITAKSSTPSSSDNAMRGTCGVAHLVKAGWSGAAARSPFPSWQHPKHSGLTTKGRTGMGGTTPKDGPSAWATEPPLYIGPSTAPSAKMGAPDQVRSTLVPNATTLFLFAKSFLCFSFLRIALRMRASPRLALHVQEKMPGAFCGPDVYRPRSQRHYVANGVTHTSFGSVIA